MTKEVLMFWKYAPVIALLILSGCNSHSAEERVDPSLPNVELVTYKVPDGSQEIIKEVLNRSFRALTPHPIARIEVLPGGQLAVLAPPSVQEGVKAMIKDLGSNAAIKPQNARLSLWMVLAKPGDSNQYGEGLGPIESILAEVAMGEHYQYTLLDRLGITAAMGTRSEGFGRYFSAGYKLSQAAGRTVVNLEVEGHQGVSSNLQTQLYMETGKFTVLGESSFFLIDKVAGEMGIKPGAYALYYILRADTL